MRLVQCTVQANKSEVAESTALIRGSRALLSTYSFASPRYPTDDQTYSTSHRVVMRIIGLSGTCVSMP